LPAQALTTRTETELQAAIHEPHAAERDHVLDALAISPYRSDTRTYNAMSQCCTTARVYIDPAVGKVHPYIHRCKKRLCPFCARARTARVAHQVDAVLAEIPRPRQLILTVASSDAPLADQLVHLRKSFARFRRTKLWLQNVTGGIYSIEVTLNEETRQWHPHLHVVYDGRFLPFKAVQYQWHRITDGSKVIWLTEVTDKRGMSWELSKYIAKPARTRSWTPGNIIEYSRATKGARMLGVFGRFFKMQVQVADPNPPPSADTYSVSIPHVAHLANQGHVTPQRLILKIAERWPIFASYTFHKFPQLEPPDSKAERTRKLLAFIEGRPPPDSRRVAEHDQAERLDAELFVLFTRYRQEDAAGDYAPKVTTEGFRPWRSTPATG